MFDNFEKRMNEETYIPEVKINDEWISYEFLEGRKIFKKETFLHIVRQQYGEKIANIFEQNIPSSEWTGNLK